MNTKRRSVGCRLLAGLVAAGAALAFSAPACALGPVGIGNVPDWNQPTLVDNNLPAPGPVNNVNIPAAGATTAWCMPTASANIMGYYRDTMAGLSIADGFVFPNTSALPASDWRDDAVDNLSAPPLLARQDLGWYLNTNSQGDPLAPIQNFGPGTHYRNMIPGLGSYFQAHNLAPSIVNFTNPAGGAAGTDNSGVPAVGRNVPAAYQRIVGEVDADRPALLHVSYWNLLNRKLVRNGPETDLPDYDYALWGPAVGGGPGGEEYSADLGHTVTIVGYWSGAAAAIQGHPFSGLGANGSTPDALIVHDNSDGTLGNPTRALPLVLPFAAGNRNLGLNVPWTAQTEISQVPEPCTLALLSMGTLTLLAYAWRRRRGR